MNIQKILFIAATVLPIAAAAQNLSIEDLNKRIDERMANLNPYQEILNDPDPERALAGMEIMLEEGDDTLRRMALEYGLLSPNPTVNRVALEAFLKSNPVLSIRFDGSSIEDVDNFKSRITNVWDGTVDASDIGYWRVPVTGFSEKDVCYVSANRCVVTVNSDGVFFTPVRMTGHAAVSDAGVLAGTATLQFIKGPVPFTVKLLD